MEWLTRISDAIDFIEKNIAEKIDYTEVAKIACCAVTRFQNMFMFITDITPAEYVRRRRMSLSAKELLGSGIKIIDLSYKYGYESPEAFTRSFKAFHGISPSDVRKFGKYIEYPRIAFKLQIQGGHFIMDSGAKFEVYKDILVKMEIIELAETLKLVAVTGEYYPSFQNIGVYHEKYKANVANKYEPYIELGLASNVDKRAWYMFGCQVTSIGELPEGLVGVDMGLKKFACLTFRMQPGSTSEDLVGGEDGGGAGMNRAHDYLVTEWIPKNADKLLGYTAGQNGFGFNISKSEALLKTVNIPAGDIETGYSIYGSIEVYKTDIEAEPEMCYYLPIK